MRKLEPAESFGGGSDRPVVVNSLEVSSNVHLLCGKRCLLKAVQPFPVYFVNRFCGWITAITDLF
jgi:hypothetical protein